MERTAMIAHLVLHGWEPRARTNENCIYNPAYLILVTFTRVGQVTYAPMVTNPRWIGHPVTWDGHADSELVSGMERDREIRVAIDGLYQ